MKTIPVYFLVTGVLLPTLCLAQPTDHPPGEHGERHGPIRHFIEAWKLADTDHDGFISAAEFAAMPRVQNLPAEKRDNLFKRLDKDADGKLSRDELGQLAKMDDPGSTRQRLWELDTDHSGGISFEEFKAGHYIMKLPPEKQLELFKRLDTDGDGMITPKDHPQPPFKHPDGQHPDHRPEADEPGRINHKLDLNGDGALSFEEFRAGPAVKNLTEAEQLARFKLLDRNGDQKISPEDFPQPARPAH